LGFRPIRDRFRRCRILPSRYRQKTPDDAVGQEGY
jgi:hypothetical protein